MYKLVSVTAVIVMAFISDSAASLVQVLQTIYLNGILMVQTKQSKGTNALAWE